MLRPRAVEHVEHRGRRPVARQQRVRAALAGRSAAVAGAGPARAARRWWARRRPRGSTASISTQRSDAGAGGDEGCTGLDRAERAVLSQVAVGHVARRCGSTTQVRARAVRRRTARSSRRRGGRRSSVRSGMRAGPLVVVADEAVGRLVPERIPPRHRAITLVAVPAVCQRVGRSPHRRPPPPGRCPRRGARPSRPGRRARGRSGSPPVLSSFPPRRRRMRHSGRCRRRCTVVAG